MIGVRVPKLRFSEFNGEWKEKKVSEIATTVDGDRSSRYPNDKDLAEDGVIFLSTSNIVNNKLNFKEKRFITEEKFKELSKGHLEQNDLIVTLRGSIGGIVAFKNNIFEKGFINAQMMIVRLHNDVSTIFFYNWYLTQQTQNNLRRISSGSAQPQLTKSDIKNLKIMLPLVQEQQKIASFLSKVDEKIAKLEKKQELWETYKKGMMQQIFSQKLRFKDENGDDYPDWEAEKLSQIFEFHLTNSFSRADLNDWKGKVQNIHYGDIHTKFPTILDLEEANIPFINEGINLTKIKDESYCRNGDLIIADASEDYEDIGKAVELKNIGKKKVLAGLHTILARDKSGLTKEGYRSYMLLDTSVKLQIKKFATGVSVLGISKSNLGKVNLKIPSISEQTKIAGFLSIIDSKIERLVNEIEINKKYKKGLLQQMFC